MAERKKYRKTAPVVAIRLALDTSGFVYQKWRGTQRCKPGDWLVDDVGDVYTVDAETFERTYRREGPEGQYVKFAPVWAEVATADGEVRTKEGVTHYVAGDYLVCNEPDGGDAYAVAADVFTSRYEEIAP